ncbi:MAG: hypothetical protein KJN84_18005 [Bacteroidia bacterium]|nr:hypothetical protein [Bacteroidia bacterium]
MNEAKSEGSIRKNWRREPRSGWVSKNWRSEPRSGWAAILKSILNKLMQSTKPFPPAFAVHSFEALSYFTLLQRDQSFII